MEYDGESSGPPPGPRFFNPWAFVRSLRDPTDLMLSTQQRYGDTFTLPTVFGPVTFTGDPNGAQAIFTADPTTFVPYQSEVSAPLVGETSLINASGLRHRRDRKLLSPPFHGARMRAYGAIMAGCAERAAAKWTVGVPFRMLDTTQEISLDVILHAVFGLESATSLGIAMRAAVVRFVEAVRPTFLFARWMRRELFGFSAWARFRKARDHLDLLLYDVIAERRREPAGYEDILSLMMSARDSDGSALSDKELRDELLTLLTAGHETTAIAIAWAFYWLHRDRDQYERVLSEVDRLTSADPETIVKLPYLNAVCQESLRIYPVLPEVPRLLIKPLQLLDWRLPAGAAAIVSVIMVHNHEDLYPEPACFRPERFLERTFTRFEYVPFGGGARRCIGAAFALYEMKTVLVTLLRHYRLQLTRSEPAKPTRRGLTMGPADGIPMVCQGTRGSRP